MRQYLYPVFLPVCPIRGMSYNVFTFQSCLVSTSETTRIRFFMDLLIAKQKPVMLVGSAGSGKTVSVAAKLNSLPESYAITNVPFNFYTTSGEIGYALSNVSMTKWFVSLSAAPMHMSIGRNKGSEWLTTLRGNCMKSFFNNSCYCGVGWWFLRN